MNNNWYTTYAQFLVEFLPPEVSDHCLAVIQFEHEGYSPPKPFKIFNHWCRNSKFVGVVEVSWRATTSGDPMAILHQKMKRLKSILRNFNQKEYGNISGRVQGKRKELAEAQVFILNCQGDIALTGKEKKLALELNELLQAEESFYR